MTAPGKGQPKVVAELKPPARASGLCELITGYRRFRAATWPQERERFKVTVEHGQGPHTLVIGCSDSRVDPQMIFDAHPGELFVVRNVASLVPPFERDDAHHGASAALEFAVRVLEVGGIFVLGHEMCGSIGRLLSERGDGAFDFADRSMDLVESAKLSTSDVAQPELRGRPASRRPCGCRWRTS
jgi:carbonic anhydrase